MVTDVKDVEDRQLMIDDGQSWLNDRQLMSYWWLLMVIWWLMMVPDDWMIVKQWLIIQSLNDGWMMLDAGFPQQRVRICGHIGTHSFSHYQPVWLPTNSQHTCVTMVHHGATPQNLWVFHGFSSQETWVMLETPRGQSYVGPPAPGEQRRGTAPKDLGGRVVGPGEWLTNQWLMLDHWWMVR